MRAKLLLSETISYVLALLFLYTASSKLMDFRRFTWEINNQPFDNRLTPLFIYGLPAVEILAVVLLVLPFTRFRGLYLSAFLMIVFTVYVALVTFHFYPNVPCSCAGVFRHMGWTPHLVFNGCFTLLSILAIRIYQNQSSIRVRANRSDKNILCATNQGNAENL